MDKPWISWLMSPKNRLLNTGITRRQAALLSFAIYATSPEKKIIWSFSASLQSEPIARVRFCSLLFLPFSVSSSRDPVHERGTRSPLAGRAGASHFFPPSRCPTSARRVGVSGRIPLLLSNKTVQNGWPRQILSTRRVDATKQPT